MVVTSVRELTKKTFLEEFRSEILDSLRKSQNKAGVIKKMTNGRAFFEFVINEHGSSCVQFLKVDCAYDIIAEALYEYAKESKLIKICAFSDLTEIQAI